MSAMEQAPVEKKKAFKEKDVNEQNVVFDSQSKRYIEMLHPKGWEGWWLGNQLEAVEAYKDMVAEAGKDASDPKLYQELKKIWREKKKLVIEVEEEHVPPEVIKQQVEAGATQNKSSIGKAFDKVKEEIKELKEKKVSVYRYISVAETKESPAPEPAKETPAESTKQTAKTEPVFPAPVPETKKSNAWMGVWDTYTGGKVPEGPGSEAEIERYVKRVAMSRGKNTLAYAYAESLLKNAKENAVRQPAEKHRDEAIRLEQEQAKLIQELEALKQKEKEGVGPFEEPVDKKVSQTEKEKEEIQKELKLVKKGWGAKFADGFKKLFGKFSKNYEKELKLEGLDEYGFVHKPETVKRLDEYGFVHEEKKPEEPSVKLDEALKEEKIVPVEEPEKAAEEKAVEIPSEQPSATEDTVKQIDEATAKYMAQRAQEEDMSKKEQERMRGKTVWEWLKRKTGGLANMNLKEVGKVLNLYSEAKHIAGDVKAQTELIKQEKGLLFDQDEVWDEAWEVNKKLAKDEKNWIESYSAEPERARKLAVRYLAEQISDRKRELNKANEDRIVLLSLQKLQKEYAATHQGKALVPERTNQVEQKLRKEIGKLRQGQVRKSFFDFAKLFKESLDDKRWASMAAVETIEKVSKVKL